MTNISGNWKGHYVYGSEYGKHTAGKKIKFTLSLTELEDGCFEGICIDEFDDGDFSKQATVNGFIEEDYISFFKVYQTYFETDENGNSIPSKKLLIPDLTYYGNYDANTGIFSGEWEIVSEEQSTTLGDTLSIGTGAWEMQKE